MSQRNKNGFAWTTREESLVAVTKIGHYRIARAGGHAIGVGAYFRRGWDEESLGRFSTTERTCERCETHYRVNMGYSEMRHVLKPAA
jgi:hypothetical protein